MNSILYLHSFSNGFHFFVVICSIFKCLIAVVSLILYLIYTYYMYVFEWT